MKQLPVIIILAIISLIIFNVVKANKYDGAFAIKIISAVLLISGMLLLIIARKKMGK